MKKKLLVTRPALKYFCPLMTSKDKIFDQGHYHQFGHVFLVTGKVSHFVMHLPQVLQGKKYFNNALVLQGE